MVESGLGSFGILRHVLAYAGKFWGTGPLRFDGTELLRYTEQFRQAGGVVSWDVPFSLEDGTLSPETLEAFDKMALPGYVIRDEKFR